MKILDIITEAQQNNSPVYAIGDSHAEGLAYGKGIINLAHGGQPSTSRTNYSGNYHGHVTGIENAPNGSNVVIAQGCNDAANSSRAFQDSKGKTPLVDPGKIASNVASIVNAARAKGCKVVFVLFPNGDPKIKPYYGGEYQEKVRQAIKSAVGVPIVDLEGQGLSDGVHATPNAYKEAAAKIVALLGNSNEPATAGAAKPVTPGADVKKPTDKKGQKNQAGKANEVFSLAVPQGRRGTEVADVQKLLQALGYDLGSAGVDGIRGPYTTKAVEKFQAFAGLTVDGDPGPDTVGAMNKMLMAKPSLAKGLTKSTSSDVKASQLGGSETASVGDLLTTNDATVQEARESSDKYLGRKMSDEEWTALVKVTGAEEASLDGCGYVLGAILNRVRKGTWGGTVMSVVTAPSQFEPVTGASGREASRLESLPIRNLKLISNAAIKVLPGVPHNIINFTSNIDAAYKGRASISYKQKLLAKGGEVKGQSVFAA